MSILQVRSTPTRRIPNQVYIYKIFSPSRPDLGVYVFTSDIDADSASSVMMYEYIEYLDNPERAYFDATLLPFMTIEDAEIEFLQKFEVMGQYINRRINEFVQRWVAELSLDGAHVYGQELELE